MQYRSFGKTGQRVSALGFGTMRLPLLNGDQGSSSYGGEQVDAQAVVSCIRYAVDHGVNYIDTAYNYMAGNSERIVGAALQDGYRSRVFLATKCPTWLIDSDGAFDRILDEQLQKLNTDRIDMYLLHTLTRQYLSERVFPYRLIKRLEKAKSDGRVRYIGFSFHDEPEVFRTILDLADWDFCQIQLNYVDTEHQAGLAGLREAGKRGMAVSIMEPLRGGYLVHPPEEAAALFQRAGKHPVSFAFDYLWDLPEVSVVLSGMGTMAQVRENIRFAEQAGTHPLTDRDRTLAEEVKAILYRKNQTGCTGCRYCEPVCPMHIPISGVMRDYYQYTNGNDDDAKNRYRERKQRSGAAPLDCIGCRRCEAICPQHIDVPAWIAKADRLMR